MPKKIVRKKRPTRTPKKTVQRKRPARTAKTTFDSVGAGVATMPQMTEPKAAINISKFVRRGIVVVFFIWLAQYYLEKKKFDSPVPARDVAAASAVPTAVPAPGSEKKHEAVHKQKPSEMSTTLDIDGFKSKSGYVGWSKDGNGNPNVDKNIGGEPFKVADKVFEHGIGTCAPSDIVFSLNGKIKHFTCKVGADNGGGDIDAVIFSVLVDGKKLFKSHIMNPTMKPVYVDVPTKGAKELSLQVKYAHGHTEKGWADWLEPKLQ